MFKKSLPSHLQTLWLCYKPYRKSFGVLFITGFTGRLFIFCNANLLGRWVDHFIQDTHSQTHFYFLSLIVANLLGMILTFIFRQSISKISLQAMSTFYDEVTLRTSRFPTSFLDNTPTGSMITRFSSDTLQIFRLFGGIFSDFLSLFLDLLCIVVLMFFTNPIYLITIILFISFNFFLHLKNKLKIKEQRRKTASVRSAPISHFTQTFMGSIHIQCYNQSNSFLKKFLKLDATYLKERLTATQVNCFVSYQMHLLTAGLFLIMGFITIICFEHQLLTVGSFGTASSFIILAGIAIQNFFEWLTQLEEGLVAFERLSDYFHYPIESGAKLPAHTKLSSHHTARTQEKAIKPLWECVSLRFENVTFYYPNHPAKILDHVSFEVPAGTSFGIIGASGSGKSTLIQLLLGLYLVKQGNIFINERPLSSFLNQKEEDIEDYRIHFATILQNTFFLQGTIYENIDFKKEFSEKIVLNLLETLGLLPWIKSLPQGLQTQVNNTKIQLSYGQRQLLGIARCLLQNRPILVLDEATSAMDPYAEALILKALRHSTLQEKTQLIVAHRLNTIEHCQSILWLHEGKVKMIGSATDVLKAYQKS